MNAAPTTIDPTIFTHNGHEFRVYRLNIGGIERWGGRVVSGPLAAKNDGVPLELSLSAEYAAAMMRSWIDDGVRASRCCDSCSCPNRA